MVKADAVLARVRTLGQTLLGPDARERLGAWWRGDAVRPQDGSTQNEEATAGGEAPLVGPPADYPTLYQRIRVSEALWGAGNLGPGDAEFLTALAAQLGLTKEMSIACVGVGLGGAARALVDETGVWITGYEANPVVAEIGVQQCTIAGKAKKVTHTVCNYETLTLPKGKFNDVISKEAFYLVQDKARLLGQLHATMKPGGTLLFTDYVVRGAPLSPTEQGHLFNAEWGPATPISPEHYGRLIEAAGFDLRVNESISDRYAEFVTDGWSNVRRMLDHLAAQEIDATARALFLRTVAEEAELWGNRLEAFRAGRLAVHRVVALKPAVS